MVQSIAGSGRLLLVARRVECYTVQPNSWMKNARPGKLNPLDWIPSHTIHRQLDTTSHNTKCIKLEVTPTVACTNTKYFLQCSQAVVWQLLSGPCQGWLPSGPGRRLPGWRSPGWWCQHTWGGLRATVCHPVRPRRWEPASEWQSPSWRGPMGPVGSPVRLNWEAVQR